VSHDGSLCGEPRSPLILDNSLGSWGSAGAGTMGTVVGRMYVGYVAHYHVCGFPRVFEGEAGYFGPCKLQLVPLCRVTCHDPTKCGFQVIRGSPVCCCRSFASIFRVLEECAWQTWVACLLMPKCSLAYIVNYVRCVACRWRSLPWFVRLGMSAVVSPQRTNGFMSLFAMISREADFSGTSLSST
jgi:hypothetical protein